MACVVCLRALVPAPCEPVHPCRLDRGVPPPDIVNKEAQTLRKRAPRDKGAPGRAKSSPGATQIDAGNEKKLFCRKCCKYYACHTELRFGPPRIDPKSIQEPLGRPPWSTLAAPWSTLAAREANRGARGGPSTSQVAQQATREATWGRQVAPGNIGTGFRNECPMPIVIIDYISRFKN